MKTHKKPIVNKKILVAKTSSAELAIGTIEKDTDTFILTYGQFSLIDALMAILNQTGPAHVSLSTWTAATGHLDRSAELLSSAHILSFRMIVDLSFKNRQPGYFNHMIDLFGENSIREIKTHAKYMVIRNEKWNIVVRTSMNLNGNPRLENIEISDNLDFADFFQKIVDEVFNEIAPGERSNDKLKLKEIPESCNFKEVQSSFLDTCSLKEPSFTHEIKNHG